MRLIVYAHVDYCEMASWLRRVVQLCNFRCEEVNVLIDDQLILQSLRRICGRLVADSTAQADMMQECLVHLWRTEREKPNQTRSWYLQSCRFHLQHWLASGRSLDNPRRGDIEIVDGDGEHPALSEYHTDGQFFEGVCFRDTLLTLNSSLGKHQRAVLNGLVHGQTMSEIASSAKLSYPTVLKYRSMIAGLTTKLGIASNPTPPSRTAAARRGLNQIRCGKRL